MLQKYFFTVKATTSVGDSISSSDGVIIIPDGGVLEGIRIKDGQPCPDTGLCPIVSVKEIYNELVSFELVVISP